MFEPWTPKEDRFLVSNWGKLSASQIAKKLGRCSKNSVISRAHTIGLRKLRNGSRRRSPFFGDVCPGCGMKMKAAFKIKGN